MFFLGILGILQVLFLPGAILLRIIQFKSRPVAVFMAVITSSLVINYCLVFLLTAIHLYPRPILIAIVLIEIGVLTYQYRFELQKPIEFWLQKTRDSIFHTFSNLRAVYLPINEPSVFHFLIKFAFIGVCLVLAYISLNWIVKLLLWNVGSVFNSYDSFAQWNRWALHWAANTLPNNTWRYPQLLPTNWSILFLMVGDTSIKFFAQSITPLFTLFILTMIVDLGFAKRNPGYFLGAVITYLTLKKFLGYFLIAALADMPSAFMAFSSIYLLLIFLSDTRTLKKKMNYGLLITISAAGCAVTKQVGFVFMLLFSILFILFFIKPYYLHDKKMARNAVLIFLSIAIFIIVPWYLYKQIQIWQGLEKSEVQMIVGATEYAFRSVSLNNQLLAITQSLGKYFYLLIFILLMSFFVEPIVRGMIWLVVLPLFVSWSLFVSYDFRNLALALPIFGICSGVSIQTLFVHIYQVLKRVLFSRISLGVVLTLFAVVIFLLGMLVFTDGFIKTRQNEKEMASFSPFINTNILPVVKNDSGDFSIITDYPLETIQELAGKKNSFLFTSLSDYQLTINYNTAKNLYMLVPKHADKNIMADIIEKINSGKYELLFEDDSWIPYMFIKILAK